MAWWLCKYYSSPAPGFQWLDEDKVEEPVKIGSLGLSQSLRRSARNIPRLARYCRPYRKPPPEDIFDVSSAVAVNARFRDLVESFEPGLHLFVPIELKFFDGKTIPGEYFYFNANVDIDCILTMNKPEWFRPRLDGSFSSAISAIQDATPIDIILSRPQIEGRHLWTGGLLGWDQLFVSDQFCKALRKSRFGKVEFRRECLELDRPWIAEENMGPLIDLWREYVTRGRALS